MTDLETKARALAEAVLNRHSGTDVVDAARAVLAALDAEPSAPAPAPSEPCTVHEEVLDGALVRVMYTGTRPEPTDEAVARELGWGALPNGTAAQATLKLIRHVRAAVAAARAFEEATKEKL